MMSKQEKAEELIRAKQLIDECKYDEADHLIKNFEEKAQRVCKGYPPGDAVELVEWVKERLIIPAREWQALLEAIDIEQGRAREQWLPQAAKKLVRLQYLPKWCFLI